MANFNSITSTLQLNERNPMEKSKEFAKEMLSFVQQILEDINKLLVTLGESKCLLLGHMRSAIISSVMSRNKHIRQFVRETLLLLQDDLLKACDSLAHYGTNKDIYKEIRGDISCKETQQLKRFLDTCTKRLNATIESYNDFCNVTGRLRVEIDKQRIECEKVLNAEKSHSFWSKVGYGVCGAGLATLVGGAGVVVFTPIVVPALAVGAVIGAAGVTGASGLLGGAYMNHLRPQDDDMKVVTSALNELNELSTIINHSHNMF